MALLPVEPDETANMSIVTSTDLSSFGDGYVQVVPTGIRPDRQRWNLTYKNRPARIPAADPLNNPAAKQFDVINEFFATLGVGGKFEWVPPHASVQKKFMIETYSVGQPFGKAGQQVSDFSATVLEVSG